jgi:dihydropteroate synthase
MTDVARRTQAGVCVMHMQGKPQTMQNNPHYADVVREVIDYLRARRDALVSSGIDSDRIAIDPGLGFGKRQQHNVDLLRQLAEFHELGQPLLVGHSRKGFLARLVGPDAIDRTAASLGAALAIASAGVQVLRIHDVAATRQAWTCFAAIRPTTWPTVLGVR